jgi:phosphotriesterase-related protein
VEKIQTVLGSISKDELGITLPHEHLLVDTTYRLNYRKPTDPFKISLVNAPVTLENLGEIRRDTTFSKDNHRLDDIRLAIEELNRFKRAGGNSLVEMTLPGVGRNPSGLQFISKETGVNIVMATGWYVSASHPKFIRDKGVDELQVMIIRELTEGVSHTDTKAGVIKAACSYPLQEAEEKVLSAAALAQRETGAPLTFHPPCVDVKRRRNVKIADRVLDILIENGADPKKIYVSHMDGSCTDYRITRLDLDYHRDLMEEYGVTLDYDTFGNETFADGVYPGASFPCDRLRTAAVVELCKEGYEKQLMLSQDIFMKIQLAKYGGYGYAHILKHIIPVLKLEGVTNKQIGTMLIENPKSILSW